MASGHWYRSDDPRSDVTPLAPSKAQGQGLWSSFVQGDHRENGEVESPIDHRAKLFLHDEDLTSARD